jgi:hypothetical protein
VDVTAPLHQQVVVGSTAQLQEAVTRFTAEGFGPRQMSDELAILVRSGRQKRLGLGFILLSVLCFPVGLLVAINRSRQAAESTVTIRVEAAAPETAATPAAPDRRQELRLSDDGQQW